MMRLAQRNGVSPLSCRPGPLRDFLIDKQLGNPHRRIKFYAGHIFVFCSTSTKCITVYPYKENKDSSD